MLLRNWASVLSIALLCSIPAVSRADTIFDLGGTLVDGGTFTGTVTLDTTTGYFEHGTGYLTVTDGGTYNLSLFGNGGDGNSPYSEIFFGSGAEFILNIFGSTPLSTGYAGGDICSTAATCGGNPSIFTTFGAGGATVDVGSGSLSLPLAAGSPSATPEPSSLALLGTGLVGAFVVGRRRFFKA